MIAISQKKKEEWENEIKNLLEGIEASSNKIDIAVMVGKASVYTTILKQSVVLDVYEKWGHVPM